MSYSIGEGARELEKQLKKTNFKFSGVRITEILLRMYFEDELRKCRT